MQTSPFKTRLEIIGINPFVFLPEKVLNNIFHAAGKCKSPIPVKGTVNGKPFRQNVMNIWENGDCILIWPCSKILPEE